MELKTKWDSLRCRRLSQVSLKEFPEGSDCEKYQACAQYTRDSTNVRRLVDEIEQDIRNHHLKVKNLARRYKTTKAFKRQGDDFYDQKFAIKALQSINKAILEAPLALVPSLRNGESEISQQGHSEKNETRPFGKEVVGDETYSCSCNLSEDDQLWNSSRDLIESYRQCLAQCFALRGKLLLNRNQPKEAAVDFGLSLSLHHCRPLQCTLYFLLGESLKHQGEIEKSREAYQSCQALLSKVECACNDYFELPNKESIVRILAALENSNAVAKSYQRTNSSGPPSLSQDEDTTLAYGSSLIEANLTKEKGRFLQAKGKIKAGDSLIVEEPYAAVLLPEYYNTHCYHCVETIVVPYPCFQCDHVRFCSPECASDAWSQYHNAECQIWPLISMVDTLTHLSIRSLLVTDRSELLDIAVDLEKHRDEPDRIPGFSVSGVYQNDYRAVFNLVTNTDMQPRQALFSFSLTASVVTPLLLKAIECDSSGSVSNFDKWGVQSSSIRRSRSWESCTLDRSSSPKIVHLNSIASAFSLDRSSSSSRYDKGHSQSLEDFTRSGPSSLQSGTGDHSNAIVDIFSSCESCILSRKSHIPEDSRSQLPETQLGVLLLHHLQQMSCNVFAITKLVTSRGSRTENDVEYQSTRKELKRVAVALYPTACLLNHSCDPDVIVSFHGATMVVRATHNIQPGEEITHCYGPHVGHMIRAARQKMLRNQYYFTCRCAACRRDEEREKQQMCRLNLLCPMCRGAMKVSLGSETYMGSCNSEVCGIVTPVSKEIQAFRETVDELSEAFAIGRQGEMRRSLSLLQAVLRTRSSILVSNDKYIGEVHDGIARCYAALGNWSLAAYHCSLNLEAVERQYGPTSAQVAHMLHRLSQYLLRGNLNTKAIDVIERSITLLSHHYGRDNPDVKNLLKIRHGLRDYKSPFSQFVM